VTKPDTDTTAAPPAPQQNVTRAADQWLDPDRLNSLYRLAKALSMSGDMVPMTFRGNPEAVLAAILRGREVGLAPMQALLSIAVINGRPVIWGDAPLALVQQAGHHVDVEYEGSGDTLVAVATLTRGDTGRQIVRRFGIADAKRAGLFSKPGPWQQYPQRMLAHRARSWAIRDGAADVLMGVQIAKEVQDYGPDRARDVTPQQRSVPPRGGVVLAPPEPDVDEIVELGPTEAPPPPPSAPCEEP
jgi:hypothetical protein